MSRIDDGLYDTLNRAQRRALDHAARRTQFGRPRPSRPKRAPILVASLLVLAPLEQIIDQIERDGTVDTGTNGEPMFQDGEGRWYDTAAALEGLIWHFDMHCTRHKVSLPVEPLRALYKCLHFMMPVTETNLRDLRAAMPVLRRALALADPEDALDILKQARIKEGFEMQSPTQQPKQGHAA